MEYFAGLDISMKETHICVVDRDGKVVYEATRLMRDVTRANRGDNQRSDFKLRRCPGLSHEARARMQCPES
jgi:hypothetical protein